MPLEMAGPPRNVPSCEPLGRLTERGSRVAVITPGGGPRSLPRLGGTLAPSIHHCRERSMSAPLARRCVPPRVGFLYAFSPIPLLPRVLRKIRNDKAQVILVASDWARSVWYLKLLGLRICPPTRLPLREDL